jgi:hypothetical protein
MAGGAMSLGRMFFGARNAAWAAELQPPDQTRREKLIQPVSSLPSDDVHPALRTTAKLLSAINSARLFSTIPETEQ